MFPRVIWTILGMAQCLLPRPIFQDTPLKPRMFVWISAPIIGGNTVLISLMGLDKKISENWRELILSHTFAFCINRLKFFHLKVPGPNLPFYDILKYPVQIQLPTSSLKKGKSNKALYIFRLKLIEGRETGSFAYFVFH